MFLKIFFWVFTLFLLKFVFNQTCSKTFTKRIDCHPRPNANVEKCLSKFCCWSPQSNITNIPYCYYPMDHRFYEFLNYTYTNTNFNGIILNRLKRQYLSIKIDINIDSIRLKITDIEDSRFFLKPFFYEHMGESYQKTNIYLKVEDSKLVIYRRATQQILFTLDLGILIFENQYIEFSIYVKTPHIFGLGEEQHKIKRNMNTWSYLTLLASDQAPEAQKNLYGAQPYFMAIEEDANAFGVMLLNSNAMDITLSPRPAITYRMIGGIIDLFVFSGPTPESVTQQLTDVIGKPFMPPYWSLGFHLCRFGYNNLTNMKATLERNLAHNIPIDVQWNDIDVMQNRMDFTFDRKNFGSLPNYIGELHQRGMKYMAIIDPAIRYFPNATDYKPFVEGVRDDVFIRHPSNPSSDFNQESSKIDGKLLVGKVWPGETVFPDFTHPNTSTWWYNQFKSYHDMGVQLDGVWIDMNEPSNFVDGSIDGCSDINDHFNNPPDYKLRVNGGFLTYHTICMNAVQYESSHYNLHNLYGLHETKTTHEVSLRLYPKTRPFIISRSNFLGLGHYGGHWSGDVWSDFASLGLSISSMLAYNLFGIPMTGSDICGFNGNTSNELCLRWFQLGAFYPFSRSHNTDDAMDQDPAAFVNTYPILIEATQKALYSRYLLLPYLYTLFYESHKSGHAVIKPLFYDYPNDTNTYDIESQFLWGSCLLISPVITENTYTINAYFPGGPEAWYDFYSGQKMLKNRDSLVNTIRLNAPLDHINVHVKSGCILPLQRPALNTKLSRLNDFYLLVALNKTGSGQGLLYMDDGKTYDSSSIDNIPSNIIEFMAHNKSLTSKIIKYKYHPGTKGSLSTKLTNITLFGVQTSPQTVVLKPMQKFNWTYVDNTQVLMVTGLSLHLGQIFKISWA